VSYGKATPYFPIIDVLKRYSHIEEHDDTRTIRAKVTGQVLTLDPALQDTVPALLSLLDALPEDSPFLQLDPPQRRQRTLDALKRVLLRESQEQPLLLVFEDLHWIDSETQALLNNLVESLPSARLLLLVNYTYNGHSLSFCKIRTSSMMGHHHTPSNKKDDPRMLQLVFSEADKQALHYERYHHPHPRVQQRMEALWLKSQGVPHHQIAQLCAISANTLRSYLQLYQRGGVEALKQLNFHCPQSALSAYRDTIETHVREHPPQTINEAVAMLEALTGIRRSPTQVRLFLTHLGLHRRKVGLLPAKGDPDAQEEYQKKVGTPLSRSTSG
jgi:transposase